MPVRVRMAPSPTGFLHIGNVRTALFNWLFARNRSGEFRLRIENTDTNREVEAATQQIQDSLRWLGLDWDGEVTFQLDRLPESAEVARRLVDEGKAYEDEGAIRFRMPDEGVTAWDDAVRGRIEFPNEKLEDVVLVRSDGRPTYNFASPLEDVWDEITHVIRGEDHISNTPKQINIIRALGVEPPVYAHVSHVLGPDGKSLSKRHGSVTVDEFRQAGYYAPALLNFLALLGWSYDDKTTIMSRDELIERFSLDRVVSSPATFDYEKLDWLNGMYLRALSPDEYAGELVRFLRDEGYGWDETLIRRAAPIVQEKIERFGQFPDFAGFLFREIDPDPALLNGAAPVVTAARDELERVDPFAASEIEAALRGVAERLELSPRKAFEPIRIGVTGSKVSPGLFESLELLGKEETLRRLSVAADRAAA
ncbi:MAG TPA: glutamate--tRNA ligase [Gaiellaceae bacterium]